VISAWHVVGLVAVGGAVGAVLRHLAGVLLSFGIRPIPEATFVVNVTASFLLGLIVGDGVSEELFDLLGLGVCGALSTYSSFALENDRLLEQGRAPLAVEYMTSTLVVGIAAASLGYWGGTALAQG
jgi:CrcB protein